MTASASPKRVVLFGASGRMGHAIREVLSDASNQQQLEGVLTGSVRRNRVDGSLQFYDAADQEITAQACFVGADVAIDFSLPDAVNTNLELCAKFGVPYVCGVTGLTSTSSAAFATYSNNIALLHGSNMSVGVNVCFAAAADIAARLHSNFTVSIFDLHHAGKKDAPSGTALEFGKVIQEAVPADVELTYESVREGNHPGTHHVVFRSGDEVIELRHAAGSRAEFAKGAIRAATWLATRTPGLYNMRNVLGITSSS